MPRVLILRAPGTNCDLETEHAFELAGAKCDRVHINRLLEEPGLPEQYQILCLPGGFSYGDDIAAGRILAGQIQHRLQDAFAAMQEADKLVLGICNGFQVLIKSGILLPDEPGRGPAATLTWNDSGQFMDRWVDVAVEGTKSVFLSGIESMYLPIAHAEGRFVARDAATLSSLGDAGQLVLRYAPSESNCETFNPNGSQANVAGLCDKSGRILGLMPHPERYVDPTQHPRWTRGEASDVGEGLRLFQNAVRYFD